MSVPILLKDDKRCKDAKIKELMNSIQGLEKNYCARIQSLMKTIVRLRDEKTHSSGSTKSKDLRDVCDAEHGDSAGKCEK